MDVVDNIHKIKYTKQCVVCGAKFGAWNQNQKFCCEPCKRKYTKIKEAEYRENEKKRSEERQAKKKKQGELNNISVAAGKAGMSYGQYVAMMKL